MKTAQLPQFHLDSYPKSYGSIEGWRLSDYLHLPEHEHEQIYKHLEHFCLQRADKSTPRKEYQGYTHLGSGWEWSVFAKNNTAVVKVPAGIFPEVNSPQYLANAQKVYQLLHQYYPSSMLADTSFTRHNDTNVVEQVRLRGQDNMLIDFEQADPWLLRNLITFFESTAALLENENWLPDFWLNEDPEGFILRNVMIDSATNQFTIIDFTSYLDPARMYPALCTKHCTMHSNRVQDMLATCHIALNKLNHTN